MERRAPLGADGLNELVALGALQIDQDGVDMPAIVDVHRDFPRVSGYVSEQQEKHLELANSGNEELTEEDRTQLQKTEEEAVKERKKDIVKSLGKEALNGSYVKGVSTEPVSEMALHENDFNDGFNQGVTFMLEVKNIIDGLDADYDLSEEDLEDFDIYIKSLTDFSDNDEERDALEARATVLMQEVLKRVPEAGGFYDSMPFKLLSIGFSHAVLMGVDWRRAS